GLTGIVLCCVQLSIDLRHMVRPGFGGIHDDDVMDLKAEYAADPGLVTRQAAIIFAWILGLFASIYVVGFIVVLPVFVGAYLLFQGREKLSVALCSATGIAVFQMAVFHYILRVPWLEPLV